MEKSQKDQFLEKLKEKNEKDDERIDLKKKNLGNLKKFEFSKFMLFT